MSSNTVSQILSVTAAKPDAKPQEPTPAQGDQFQRLLARASGSEQRPARTAETDEAPDADEPVSNSAGQDAESSSDESLSTQSDPLSAAVVENEEPDTQDTAEDELVDEFELSEAASLAVAAQAPIVVDQSVEPVDATANFEVVATPVELVDGETPPPEPTAKPQAVTQEFTQSFDAAPQAAESAESTTVVVDPAAKVPTDEQTPAEQPSGKQAAEPVLEAVEKTLQTVESEAAEEAAKPTQAVASNGSTAAVKLPKPAPQTAKQSSTVPAEDSSPVVDEPEVAERAAKPAPVAVAATAAKELVAAVEVKVVADKKTTDEPKTRELPVVQHAGGNDSHRATNSADPSNAANATHGESAGDSDPVSTADRVRFVQRVSRAFQSAQSRDGVVHLRLNPPELGSLRIAIATHQGVLSAKIEADTAAARTAILDNLPALRERLAEQQIRLEKFDVDVRRDGGQEPSNWGTPERQPRNGNNNPSARTPSTTTSPRVGRSPGGVADGSLDVRI